MMVVLRFDASSLRSKVILEWIKNKLFAGISLGYISDVTYENGLIRVVKKTIHELSIVRTPHHNTCRVQFVGNSIPPLHALGTHKTTTKDPFREEASIPSKPTAASVASELEVFFDAISGGAAQTA